MIFDAKIGKIIHPTCTDRKYETFFKQKETKSKHFLSAKRIATIADSDSFSKGLMSQCILTPTCHVEWLFAHYHKGFVEIFIHWVELEKLIHRVQIRPQEFFW
jgi:hypothetical protein